MVCRLLEERSLSVWVETLARPRRRRQRGRGAPATRSTRPGILDLHLAFAGDACLFEQWRRASTVPLHVWEVSLAPYL